MDILQLAPMVRRLREQVEAEQLPLEESMRTLSYASELILFKVRWLLPNAQPEREDAQDEAIDEETSLEAATATFVMDPWVVLEARNAVGQMMDKASAMFTRGRAFSYKDDRQVFVSGIDPREVRDAFLSAVIRTGPHERGIPLPRWSFVNHLRDFWREVRKLTSRGDVLRFSRFLGQSKMDAILNFLAFLELVKRRRLYARQRSLFGEIVFSTDEERISQEEAES